MTDLISRGAKIRPRPLNTRRSEAVTVPLFIPPAVPPHRPQPGAFCTLPSFARIKRPRWRPVELNCRHLRSHGKIGDCEQSMLQADISQCQSSCQKYDLLIRCVTAPISVDSNFVLNIFTLTGNVFKRYKQTFAVVCSFIVSVNKLRATDSSISPDE